MKIVAILKKAVYVWGITSLCLVVIFGIWIAILYRQNQTHTNVKEETTTKSFQSVELKVLKMYGKDSTNIYISLADSGKVILERYHLPLTDHRLTYADVDSACVRVYPDGDARIIIFSRVGDCDPETRHLWFLRRTGKGVRIVKVLELHDLNIVEPEKEVFWGFLDFTIEYVEGTLYAPYKMSVEVRVDDKIHITPLLNNRGIALLKQSYETEIEKRIAILKKNNDVKKIEKVKSDLMQFEEIINGVSYNFQ